MCKDDLGWGDCVWGEEGDLSYIRHAMKDIWMDWPRILEHSCIVTREWFTTICCSHMVKYSFGTVNSL